MRRDGPRFVLLFVGLVMWMFAGACGTVLPPLDEDAGTVFPDVDDDVDGASEDVSEDDADTSGDETDASEDVSIEAGSADVCGADACVDVRADADVRRDMGDAIPDGRGDTDGNLCPAPVDCANASCNGVSCGAHGLACKSGACACPGAQTKETSCSDGADNDCDGLVDCADPDCGKAQCGASANQRCCGTTCVNTETDAKNCQGCGLACASGQTCKRISDTNGTRGACTCAGITAQCPKNPAQVCRTGNNDGMDNLCACDKVNTGDTGCADGQVCVDVTGANYCRY